MTQAAALSAFPPGFPDQIVPEDPRTPSSTGPGSAGVVDADAPVRAAWYVAARSITRITTTARVLPLPSVLPFQFRLIASALRAGLALACVLAGVAATPALAEPRHGI